MDISRNWKIIELPLDEFNPAAVSKAERMLPASLPCDVRMPLIEAGIIGDPVDAVNCREQEWIEDRSWWFIREILPSEFDPSAEICELVIDSIDTYAEIYLNGEKIGTHKNVNVPFVCDIKECLKEGQKNVLTVRVTTGLELVSEEEIKIFNLTLDNGEQEKFDGSFMPKRGDNRRAFIRRPQYATGWDWMPRMTSCGITGRAQLNCYSGAIVRQMYLHTVSLHKEEAVLRCKVELELCDMFRSADGKLFFQLTMDGQTVAMYEQQDIFLKSGYNSICFDITVPRPQIWWPNGMGAQPVYQASLSVETGGITHTSKPLPFGISSIELDLSRRGNGERNFGFIINGVKTFCKGGNWVPADAVYARVDETRYNRLVEEAKEANFNMFRLWGGGIYEPDCFFEACLRNGILLWQDLMFSCASYPDHEEDFRNECQKEIEYQTKRLRRYSNLALLCGNNEITLHQSPLAQFHYDYSMDHRNTCGYHIFNNLAAEIAEKNCPHISYWNSSPYGGPMPNCSEIGDQHYWWPVCQKKGGNAMVEPTSYDRITSNFVSEYGCMGPLNKESMLAYDGGREPELNSPMFLHHTNSFENGMISSGIEQNYRSMKGISLDDYILCGQMMQSVLYQYSFEAMRYNDRCNGALLWMYHDVWGENGWSIVDYYIRRKASYYGVKRALAPARAIFRQESNEICLKLANDGPQPLLLQGSVGFLSYDGQRGEMKKTTFQAAPYSCEVVARWKTADLPEDGTLFFLPDGGKAEMAYWYRAPFRELSLPQPQLIVSQHVASDNTVLTVRSVTFAHGVHYIGDYLASDQYFDLAPGEEKTITVYRTGGKALEVGAMMPDGEQAAAYHADAV